MNKENDFVVNFSELFANLKEEYKKVHIKYNSIEARLGNESEGSNMKKLRDCFSKTNKTKVELEAMIMDEKKADSSVESKLNEFEQDISELNALVNEYAREKCPNDIDKFDYYMFLLRKNLNMLKNNTDKNRAVKNYDINILEKISEKVNNADAKYETLKKYFDELYAERDKKTIDATENVVTRVDLYQQTINAIKNAAADLKRIIKYANKKSLKKANSNSYVPNNGSQGDGR